MAHLARRLATRSLNSNLSPSPHWPSVPPKFTLSLGDHYLRRIRYFISPPVRTVNANFSTLTVLLRNMSTSAQPDERDGLGGDEKGHRHKMSAEELQIYGAFAMKMDNFHEYFRTEWKAFQAACQDKHPLTGTSKDRLLSRAVQFCRRLTMHHHIEETYVFPVLAQKMPEFRAELGIVAEADGEGRGGGGKAELLTQHEAIHAGLVGFEAYVRACRDGKEELDWETLRGKMESWGDVLWRHLDEEVRALGAENMKKYWSVEEMFEILSF